MENAIIEQDAANMKPDMPPLPPIKTLPEEERPYEKCWSRGERSLSDAELLSVILRTGVSGESALDLSRRIVKELGADGLAGLYHHSVSELQQIRGVGKVKAIQLKCIAELSRRIARGKKDRGTLCFHDPDFIAEYYMEEYRHEEREKVLMLMLDTKGRLLGEEIISSGTVNCSLISPREVFMTALRNRCVSIILMHNHPSGDPTPSEEDREITKRLAECGRMLQIELLDHIIIGDNLAYSFRSEGLL